MKGFTLVDAYDSNIIIMVLYFLNLSLRFVVDRWSAILVATWNTLGLLFLLMNGSACGRHLV